MPAVFLIRETQLFAKYSTCTKVEVTSNPTAYGNVTGLASSDLISVPGSTPVDGYGVTFTNLAGGSGLNVGARYFIRDASGSDFKVSLYQGGPAVNFTTDITSASSVLIQVAEIMVWSASYRDIFSTGSTTQTVSAGGDADGLALTGASSALIFGAAVLGATGGINSNTILQVANLEVSVSDDIKHFPLRQTLLARSYWKFTMSAGATPLYAEVMEGDIISDTAPNIQ